jgi:hypothetical protein
MGAVVYHNILGKTLQLQRSLEIRIESEEERREATQNFEEDDNTEGKN